MAKKKNTKTARFRVMLCLDYGREAPIFRSTRKRERNKRVRLVQTVNVKVPTFAKNA